MRTFANIIPLFPIGLGAMPLSIPGRPSENEAIRVIRTFIDTGGNFIDTANIYGLDDTDRGHNEKLIQQAITQAGKQDQIIVATKGGASRPQGGWAFSEGHPTQLRKACEQSLKHLKTSSHSLYYLHGCDPAIPFEDSLGELIMLKSEGKIQHIGIANVNLEQIKKANQLTEISAVQNRCNPFCKEDFSNGVIDFCQKNKMIYVPYCLLGGWADHAALAQHEAFKILLSKHQQPSYSICLSWLLAKADHIIPIPGMDKVDHVSANFSATQLNLSADDIKAIDTFPNLYSAKHTEK